MQELKQSTHFASCAYCSCLKMLRKTVHKQKLLKQSINGTQSIVTAISILTASAFSLNYRWQNAFNPLQCSVRSLFNVFHLPTNHKAIKTLHTSFCLQPQYAEPKEKLTSVQQTLELTFSSLGSSLPPLWNNSFTGKLFSISTKQDLSFDSLLLTS